jgi:hypothetical protein
MAIPVSPVTPLRVTIAVLVEGRTITHPAGAGEVGGVMVLAPDCRTTFWTMGLPVALEIVMGPIVRFPVTVPCTDPEMVTLDVAAIFYLFLNYVPYFR